VPAVQNVPILLGSLDDPESLLNIAEQTKVLISTAGPYIQMGTPVIDACVKAGCHYTDLTGTTPKIHSNVAMFLQSSLVSELDIMDPLKPVVWAGNNGNKRVHLIMLLV
jgi:short subunit dehydrogenase-like uncharacterized protein